MLVNGIIKSLEKKAIESYKRLGSYLDPNGGFTFDILKEPMVEEFEEIIGEKATLVAKIVLNTEENFPLKYTKKGELFKRQREYYDPDNKEWDGRIIDYIELHPLWTSIENEWLYFLVYDGHIVKIGMTITSLKDRAGSYNCGTRRAMEKGSCSTTNFIISECNAFAVQNGIEAEIYSISVSKEIKKVTRFGVTKECIYSVARDAETMLTDAFIAAYGHKPVLCVQEGK